MNDSICGNCGRTKSTHMFEFGKWYCYPDTTADIFSDHPGEAYVSKEMLDRLLKIAGVTEEELTEKIVSDWRKNNGHPVQVELQY